MSDSALATIHTESLHTLAIALKRLSVSRSTLYRLITAGELATVKLGRRRLITENSIRQLLLRLQAGNNPLPPR